MNSGSSSQVVYICQTGRAGIHKISTERLQEFSAMYLLLWSGQTFSTTFRLEVILGGRIRINCFLCTLSTNQSREKRSSRLKLL